MEDCMDRKNWKCSKTKLYCHFVSQSTSSKLIYYLRNAYIDYSSISVCEMFIFLRGFQTSTDLGLDLAPERRTNRSENNEQ